MRGSQALIPTQTRAPSGLGPGAAALFRGGFAQFRGRSLSALLPLGQMLASNLEALTALELEAIGCQRVALSSKTAIESVLTGCHLDERDFPISVFAVGGAASPSTHGVTALALDKDDVWAESSRARFESAAKEICRRAGAAVAVAGAGDPSGGEQPQAASILWIVSDPGPDSIALALDPASGYAATADVAKRTPVSVSAASNEARGKPLERVSTPDSRTVADVASALGVGPADIIKTIVVLADGKPLAACVRGDRTLSLPLLRRAIGATEATLASADEVLESTGCEAGFVGPVGLAIPIVADSELCGAAEMVCGAGEIDAHLRSVVLERDADVERFEAISSARPGDLSASGTTYEWIDAIALARTARSNQRATEPGVTSTVSIDLGRLLLAAADASITDAGIALPLSIAPVTVAIAVLKMTDAACAEAGEKLYRACQNAEQRPFIDDRATSAQAKLRELPLRGATVRCAIGPRSMATGEVEIRARGIENPMMVSVGEAAQTIARILDESRRKEHTAWT